MQNNSLGDRMKKYEYVTRTHLLPRTPVIIRIDGRAFHTFTRGFVKPFDDVFAKAMLTTMKYLCENIQGCVLGYTQSDEISLILIDYKELDSQGWFDYNIQKCTSVAASMATLQFNRSFVRNANSYMCSKSCYYVEDPEVTKQIDIYYKAAINGATFDARAFNLPKEEVTNYLLWRQNDATRNSINMVGFANFSPKQMHGKSCSEIQDMLMLEKGINWNNFPTVFKRGSCCLRKPDFVINDTHDNRKPWMVDEEIPIFRDGGRDYIERLINTEGDNDKT